MSEGKLTIRDSRTSRDYEIPIHRNVIDAAKFKAIRAPAEGTDLADQVKDGIRLYDPGLRNTATVESKLTFSDSSGMLQPRGIPVEELFHNDYEDVFHLIVWGHLPTPEEKERLRSDFIAALQNVPPSVPNVIQAFPRSTAPMLMIIAGLSAYLGSVPKGIPTTMGGNIYHGNMRLVDKAVIRAASAYAICVALTACHRTNRAFTPADPQGSFLENLLLMMGNVDPRTGKPDPIHVRALHHTWALGFDAGPTNSTFALLLSSSTLTDPISGLIAALSSGYGPLHFGATEVAYKNMRDVGRVENVPAMIERVKRGEAKLFGYGHRTYRTEDPRIKGTKKILQALKAQTPVLDIATEIVRAAGEDEYFVKRGLHANADLYGVFIYIALEYEPEMVPVMMMGMRTSGLMAHWREAMSKPNAILSPALFYTGPVTGTGPVSKI
ncbi:citrate synthase [Lasallia pustulata]|uniref:Citrate synthase n=1 Tax=Lasallia pustulata TaxID=136370 RepID=A0A1W5CY58_9LECA|nr:citrate synthase [Lasallia pustulata]